VQRNLTDLSRSDANFCQNSTTTNAVIRLRFIVILNNNQTIFELKLVLATVVSRYQLTLASDRPEKPQRRGVTLSPAGGGKMQFQGVI
jgi:hypothetical protein